jgi:hypothetical protein
MMALNSEFAIIAAQAMRPKRATRTNYESLVLAGSLEQNWLKTFASIALYKFFHKRHFINTLITAKAGMRMMMSL